MRRAPCLRIVRRFDVPPDKVFDALSSVLIVDKGTGIVLQRLATSSDVVDVLAIR